MSGHFDDTASGPFINTNPTVGPAKALAEEGEEIAAREKLLQKQHHGELPGSDKSLPAHQRTDYQGELAAKRKNFDQKIYLFPESFNQLRIELMMHYPKFFESVNPACGCSPAWAMANDAAQFIGLMNGAFDMVEQVDTDDVSGICARFLVAARKKRGARA